MPVLVTGFGSSGRAKELRAYPLDHGTAERTGNLPALACGAGWRSSPRSICRPRARLHDVTPGLPPLGGWPYPEVADRVTPALTARYSAPTFRFPQAPEPVELPELYPDLPGEFASAYELARPYTMTSAERMYALWEATRYVLRRDVPGALVECGVWRGGSAMLMADVLRGSGRELWLYDTFSGMPEPAGGDRDFRGAPPDLSNDLVSAIATLEEVVRNLSFYEPVIYVEGKVEETIPSRAPDQIALLRLDTDWEASTRHELEHLYERLSPGGVLLIDDYGHWRGARRAVDRFFAGRDDAPLLTRIDYTGRIAIRS